MSSLATNYLYQEKWIVPFYPIIFFLPCFYKYSVMITQDEVIFGYGFSSPWKGITAQCVPRSKIQKVFIGSWTWKENLKNFGGWGIRYGTIIIACEASFSSSKKRGWVYNASNGPFVIIQLQDNTYYQFVTHEPEIVKQILSSTTTMPDDTPPPTSTNCSPS